MKRLAAIFAILCTATACAFSVQLSLTGRDSTGKWFSFASEKSGGAFGRAVMFMNEGEPIPSPYIYYHFAYVTLPTDYRDDYGEIKIRPCAVEGMDFAAYGPYVGIPVTNAEAYAFGRLSWDTFDFAWSNCVFTLRGDPYSIVMNNTSTARTINDVEIGAFTGKSLLFPLTLKMSNDPGLSFYDLESGEQIPATYSNGNGRYSLGWTGNIELRDGSTPSAIPPMTNLDQIVYADMKASDEGKVTFAENDKPVYAGLVSVSTNVQLCTWWEFNQDAWGSSPKAKINGEVVCEAHSTDHLIGYTTNQGVLHVSEMTGIGTFTFTMSQTPDSGHSGGTCVFKCWDASVGATKEGYAAAAPEHKAAVNGGAGTVAVFRVTINVLNGKWKVEPVN